MVTAPTAGDPAHAPRIDATLVRTLVAGQFPEWAGLPVRPVEPGGWDNRTFRLGEDLTVRLPSAEGYVAGTVKEQRWLPILAPQVPFRIPSLRGTGIPGEKFPFPWSVLDWIPGQDASQAPLQHPVLFAGDLAAFLNGLRGADSTGGPRPGRHSAQRGRHPRVYDADFRRALAVLGDRVDAKAAEAVWDAGLASRWTGPPVWFHGDVAAGNLLVRKGRLAAVIDFGCAGVGDPACDLTVAWTMFESEARRAFRLAVGLDNDTWGRARCWALWKAVITWADSQDPSRAEEGRRVTRAILSNPHEVVE